MDFTFRSLHQRNTNCSDSSKSSNYTYYSQQANQCDMESRYDQFLVNRDAMMERQLEKERIRREILEEEAARRRELEAEVRRELRIERELELRGRGSDQWQAPTRRRYVECGLFENRVALPFPERVYDFPRLEQEKKVERIYDFPRLEQEKKIGRMYDFPRLEQEKKIGGYEGEELPFQRASQPVKTQVKTCLDVVKVEELPFLRASQPIKTQVKTPLDVVKVEELPSQTVKTQVKTPLDVVKAEEKKQNILLAEPDANHPGKKRKDMASPVGGPSEVTKKLAKEWRCDLCQISATSELGLEDHLKGKKHKSKQAGPKTGMIGLCSKKIINPLDPSQVAERNVEPEKSQQTTNKYVAGVESNNIDIFKKKGCGGAVQKMPKKKLKNFKFYCKMCEAGAYSEEIMNRHKNGKKHLQRLHQLGAKI